MTSLLSGATGNGTEFGGYVFQDFVNSWDEFERLRGPLRLAENFEKGDFVSSFGGLRTLFRTNDVTLWKYYQSSIIIDVDAKSGIVTFHVDAYNPKFANALARALLRDAVTHLTQMNGERERQMVSAASQRTAGLNAELARQDAALASYRTQVGFYEPAEVQQARLTLMNTLAVRQTELTARYNAALHETPNNPVVSELRAALSTTVARIAEEERHIADTSRKAAIFDNMRVKRDNTVSLLAQANAAVYEAQRSAASNGYFLNVIGNPSSPVTPELPLRLRWILGIFMLSMLAWGILR